MYTTAKLAGNSIFFKITENYVKDYKNIFVINCCYNEYLIISAENKYYSNVSAILSHMLQQL